MNEATIRYGQGAQTIRFIPVDRAGRPVRVTSATFTIIDIDEGEESPERTIASGAASLSAVNTTLSAAGGAGEPDPRALSLTSVAGVTEGRTYLASASNGRCLVTVDAIAGSVVTAKDTPSVSFASGAAFQACELEASFPLSEANDSDAIEQGRRYQCTWVYTLQGEQWCTAQSVHLVRYSGEAWITEDFVYRLAPTLADRMRGRFRTSDAIAAATQDLIAELESAGQRAEGYRTGEPGQVAIRFRAIEYALRWLGGETDVSLADLYQSRYERLRDNFITGKPGTAQSMSATDDVAVSPRIDGIFNRP